MQNSLDLTYYWLRDIVIGLDLCPFAKGPFEKGLVRVVACDHQLEEEQVGFFLSELEFLNENDSSKVSTTLIVFPRGIDDFVSFNDFVGELQELLEEANLGDVFQLVAFHPKFMFSGTLVNAVENLVNRSPFPTIHILRSEEFNEQLLSGTLMGESVSMINERKLKALSPESRERLFFYLFNKG